MRCERFHFFDRRAIHGVLTALALGIAMPVTGLAQLGSQERDRASAGRAASAAGDHRPILQRLRGRVFAYSLPAGWRANETSNGIDIAARDGLTGVSASFVLGMVGTQSPEGHFRQVLATLPLSNVQVRSRAPTPAVPGPFGLQWKGVEIEFDATSQGRPVHVRAISQVLQGSGQYAALLTGIQGPVAHWDALRHWLPYVRDSIAVTDPSFAAGTMARGLPRGIRHDDVYGSYNKGWAARGVAADRISAAQREGTMGYTRQRDPATDRIYDVPLDAYDASRGGYVNPVRPTELLVQTSD